MQFLAICSWELCLYLDFFLLLAYKVKVYTIDLVATQITMFVWTNLNANSFDAETTSCQVDYLCLIGLQLLCLLSYN